MRHRFVPGADHRQTRADGGVFTFSHTLSNGVITQTVMTALVGESGSPHEMSKSYIKGIMNHFFRGKGKLEGKIINPAISYINYAAYLILGCPKYYLCTTSYNLNDFNSPPLQSPSTLKRRP